ncbi:hypothetical protein LA080_004559 [Diaporthe eres]|nr:hypothetical protein LA080_004559 [Diaporthe eres]
METLIKNAPAPSGNSEDYHTSFQSGGLIASKYSGSQPLSQLPEVYDDSQHHHAHSLCDRVSRFVAYLYAKHIRAPPHAAWCRDPRTLLRGATQVVLFDNDNWLLMRLPSRERPLGYQFLAFTGIGNIYTNWKRRDTALSAYCGDAAARGKLPCRRVPLRPGEHIVSAFEDTEEDLFVVMEMDGDGEIMFYHECLRCHDLTCRSCVEVLDNVVAFGQRHTRLEEVVRVE